MMLKKLKSTLMRRRKGAVAMLGVLAMLPASAMLTATINTGQMIEDKRRTQDAADALAVMHQTWAARSLNVISMNNVSAAQLMTVAVGAEALDHTIDEFYQRAKFTLAWIGGHAFIYCGAMTLAQNYIGAAACALDHGLGALPADRARRYSRQLRSRFQSSQAVETAHNALTAIDAMNIAIVDRFPGAVREMGKEYARTYGIDDFYFVEPCKRNDPSCKGPAAGDGMSLPVESDKKKTLPELCHAMHYGNSLVGESFGKLTEIFGEAGFGYVEKFLKDQGIGDFGIHRRSFDARGFGSGEGPMSNGGSSSNPHVRDHINAIMDSNGLYREMTKFKRYYSRTRFMTGSPPGDLLWSGINVQGNQNRSDNSFLRRFKWKLLSACIPQDNEMFAWIHALAGKGLPISGVAKKILDRIGNPEKLIPLWFNVYKLIYESKQPETWWAEGRELTNPSTLLRYNIEDMGDAYRVLVFTAKDTKKRAPGLGLFVQAHNRVGRDILPNEVSQHYGYAQAGLFNPDSADFYTQNWRFELMHAQRLNEPGSIASELNSQASGAFRNLADALSRVRHNSWGTINAH